MRVLITRGDGLAALQFVERSVPAPAAGEVLVRIGAVSLNYRDLLVINGTGSWKPHDERVPGSDGAGEVAAVGAGVTKWKAGDRVAGIFLPRWLDGPLTEAKYAAPLGGAAADGVLAEYVLFHEDALVRTPAHLSDEEAASLPVAAVTAWHAVARRSAVAAGETVLIEGTGGVALFALQFAAARGARPLVISSSDEKLARAEALGAAAGVNYRTAPDWERKILELTGGAGVEHVVETVGGENLNRALEAVKIGGTIAFIGLIAGLRAPIDTYRFVQKNVTLHGIETGSREMFEEMNRLIEAKGLRPVIDRAFAFDETRAALEYLASGSHFGKIVIKIN